MDEAEVRGVTHETVWHSKEQRPIRLSLWRTKDPRPLAAWAALALSVTGPADDVHSEHALGVLDVDAKWRAVAAAAGPFELHFFFSIGAHAPSSHTALSPP